MKRAWHLLAFVACAAALSAATAAPAAVVPPGSTARAPRMDTVARCSWDRPGHNPFVGEVVPAIDRYLDIPTPVRMRLKQRMAARRYDELVEIRRDAIRGRHDYRPEIRDMHFGVDRVCREVTRSAWTDTMRERGLVYCDSGHCILVPTVCRNVSRIERLGPAQVAAEPAEAPAAVSSQGLAGDPPVEGAPTFADGVVAALDPPVESGDPWMPDEAIDVLSPPESPDPGAAPWGPATPPIFGGPGFGGSSGGGGNGGVLPPVSPVPEPATWANLLAGLVLWGALGARRQRRAGAPRCATQKRS